MNAIELMRDALSCNDTFSVDCTTINQWDCQSDCEVIKNCQRTCSALYGFPCEELQVLERGYCDNLFLFQNELSISVDTDILNSDQLFSTPGFDTTQWKPYNNPCRDSGNLDCSYAWEDTCTFSCSIMTHCKATCNKNTGLKCSEMYFLQDKLCHTENNKIEAVVQARDAIDEKINLNAGLINIGNTGANTFDTCRDTPGREKLCHYADSNRCRQDCLTISNCPASCIANAKVECQTGRSTNSCGLDCEKMFIRKKAMASYCERLMTHVEERRDF